MQALINTYQRFVSWGEHYLRTDLRYILNGGFWLFLGQGVSMVMGVGLAWAYAHYLPKETYGHYKFILSITGVLSIFTLATMDNAAQIALANGRDAAFWTTLKIRMRCGIGATVMCGIIGLYYLYHGNTLLSGLFLISAPFLFAMDPLAHYGSLLVGKKLFREATVRQVILQVVTSLLLFVTVSSTQNIFIIVFVYMAGNTLFRLFLFLNVVRNFQLNNVPDPEAVTYGWKTSGISVLQTISSRLDSILLFSFLGPIPLATYSFAQAAVLNIQNSFKLITTTIAFPKFASIDKETLKKTLLRKVYIAHAITIPLAIGVALLIPLIYRLLFPLYLDSVPYAQVMTALLAFSPLRFISTAIMAKAKIKTIYGSAGVAPIINTACLLICVPLWHNIWSVILATTIQQTLTNAIGLYLFKKM